METIYEKQYSKFEIPEKYADKEHAESVSAPSLSYDKILKKILDGVTIVPLPDRIRDSEIFLKQAITVSERYKLSITVKRYPERIIVNYYLDCCSGLREINKVFAMADQFSFFDHVDGWAACISLDYYTHAVARHGRRLAP